MIRHQSFRFRVYPKPSQEARLLRWESAMRFLWNLANEQWRMGMGRPRGERIYPSASSQQRELTDLRKELPWLADVPRNVSEYLIRTLEQSWARCFDGLGRAPRWKRKGVDCIGLCEAHADSWRIVSAGVQFPKIGILRAVLHRPVEGKPISCTISRDGDQWFASLAYALTVEVASRGSPVVAIDRGITNSIADSSGNLFRNPKHYDHSLKRLARAQRAVSRKKKGSKNREKAKVRVMRIHRKVRRQREHFLHVLSSTITKSNGVVVIEKLNVSGMVKARPLSRSIAGAGWSRFAEMLRYKLAWSGGTLVEVPAQCSSQTCSACGVVDPASRSGERFNCTACGYLDHADLNAAKILKQRYETPGNPWCLPVAGIALGAPGRSRKARAKLRSPQTSSAEGQSND